MARQEVDNKTPNFVAEGVADVAATPSFCVSPSRNVLHAQYAQIYRYTSVVNTCECGWRRNTFQAAPTHAHPHVHSPRTGPMRNRPQVIAKKKEKGRNEKKL